jgi:hypothetical protein
MLASKFSRKENANTINATAKTTQDIDSNKRKNPRRLSR